MELVQGLLVSQIHVLLFLGLAFCLSPRHNLVQSFVVDAVTNEGLLVADVVVATPLDAHAETPMHDEGGAVPPAPMAVDGDDVRVVSFWKRVEIF